MPKNMASSLNWSQATQVRLVTAFTPSHYQAKIDLWHQYCQDQLTKLVDQDRQQDSSPAPATPRTFSRPGTF